MRIKQFSIVLAALVVVSLGNIACGANAQQAATTAQPPSEAERLRNIEREVSELKGRNTERDSRRKRRNCNDECSPKSAASALSPAPAPVAPTPRVTRPAPAPASSTYTCKLEATGEAAIEAAKHTNYVECGPKSAAQSAPPPATPSRQSFISPPPEPPTPPIAPADVPPVLDQRAYSPTPYRPAPQPPRGRCNGGPCYGGRG